MGQVSLSDSKWTPEISRGQRMVGEGVDFCPSGSCFIGGRRRYGLELYNPVQGLPVFRLVSVSDDGFVQGPFVRRIPTSLRVGPPVLTGQVGGGVSRHLVVPHPLTTFHLSGSDFFLLHSFRVTTDVFDGSFPLLHDPCYSGKESFSDPSGFIPVSRKSP